MANEELALYLAAQGVPMTPVGPEEQIGEWVDPTMERRLDNPIVRRMVEQALDPSDTMEVKITKEGEVKADMFKPEKPEGGEKAETGESKNIGYDPAMAAMTAPTGEPISAAELRGLTPEQITAVMSGEARAEQLRQGTIGQLMELPYRQALTERALRPEMTPEQKLMLAQIQKSLNPLQQFTLLKGLLQYQTTRKLSGKTLDELRELYKTNPFLFEGAPSDLVEQVTKEEKLPKKAEWIEWRNKETGEIKPMRPGTAPTPGADWERVPTKETVVRETVYEKTIAVKAAKEMKNYVTDKEGKLLDPDKVNRVGMSALSEVLSKEGKEIVELDIPAVAKNFWPDKKERSIFLVVPIGATSVDDQDIKDALTSTYGYSMDEADKAVKAYRGK